VHSSESIVPIDSIVSKIVIFRGERVIMDRDLAELYGVSTKVLNQAVKRNLRRFPSDFMFRLTKAEKNELVTTCDRFRPLKHSSASPYAFTEQGVAMLSSVLKKNPKRHTGKRQAPEAPKPGFLSDDDGRPRQASSE
jgi:hypothetical protein